MRTPTETETEALLAHVMSLEPTRRLLHYAPGYDPVAAKKYYEEHKKLKGRRKGRQPERIMEDDPRWDPKTMGNRRGSLTDPRTGKTREQIHRDAKTRQRKELTEAIGNLTKRLAKLETLIKEREAEEREAKSKAKKERAGKEKDKPKSAAEKAEAARDAEKYRDKHKQELKNKSDDKKSSKDSPKKKGGGKHTASQLRSKATQVRGQIAVYKQKLAAL